jgi:PPP family 3-phenylpropionic acid transporter
MNYQALFLGILGASPWVVGITVSLQAILEIPLMLAAPSLLRRFSWSMLILVGAIVLPIRWILYMLVQNPVWIIPTQLFHSIAIVSFMVVGVSLVNRQMHAKWRATSQGLYSVSLDGVGSGLGVFFAGNVLQLFGVRAVWMLNLGIGLIGLAIIFLALKRFDVKKTKPIELEAAS